MVRDQCYSKYIGTTPLFNIDRLQNKTNDDEKSVTVDQSGGEHQDEGAGPQVEMNLMRMNTV